ncbi:MAG: hypothetical protein GC164_15290 [Phycisphaera sp.]|nr:hypothetical protein [Phycisphaera sp.]
MPEPDQTEIDRWHKWFAIECNNRAWELITLPERSGDQSHELELVAHASAYHWSVVGKPIHVARADCLLSAMLVALRRGDEAMRYAKRYLGFCELNDCEAWDRAFAHAGVAHAAYLLGDLATHNLEYTTAKTLGESLTDEEDRKQFFSEFARVPAPRGD